MRPQYCPGGCESAGCDRCCAYRKDDAGSGFHRNHETWNYHNFGELLGSAIRGQRFRGNGELQGARFRGGPTLSPRGPRKRHSVESPDTWSPSSLTAMDPCFSLGDCEEERDYAPDCRECDCGNVFNCSYCFEESQSFSRQMTPPFRGRGEPGKPSCRLPLNRRGFSQSGFRSPVHYGAGDALLPTPSFKPKFLAHWSSFSQKGSREDFGGPSSWDWSSGDRELYDHDGTSNRAGGSSRISRKYRHYSYYEGHKTTTAWRKDRGRRGEKCRPKRAHSPRADDHASKNAGQRLGSHCSKGSTKPRIRSASRDRECTSYNTSSRERQAPKMTFKSKTKEQAIFKATTKAGANCESSVVGRKRPIGPDAKPSTAPSKHTTQEHSESGCRKSKPESQESACRKVSSTTKVTLKSVVAVDGRRIGKKNKRTENINCRVSREISPFPVSNTGRQLNSASGGRCIIEGLVAEHSSTKAKPRCMSIEGTSSQCTPSLDSSFKACSKQAGSGDQPCQVTSTTNPPATQPTATSRQKLSPHSACQTTNEHVHQYAAASEVVSIDDYTVATENLESTSVPFHAERSPRFADFSMEKERVFAKGISKFAAVSCPSPHGESEERSEISGTSFHGQEECPSDDSFFKAVPSDQLALFVTSEKDVSDVVSQWLQNSSFGSNNEQAVLQECPENSGQADLVGASILSGSTENLHCDQETVSMASTASVDDDEVIVLFESFPARRMPDEQGPQGDLSGCFTRHSDSPSPPAGSPREDVPCCSTHNIQRDVLFELNTYTAISILDICQDPVTKDRVLALYAEGMRTKATVSCTDQIRALVRAAVERRRVIWKGMTSVLRKLARLQWTVPDVGCGHGPRILQLCELKHTSSH